MAPARTCCGNRTRGPCRSGAAGLGGVGPPGPGPSRRSPRRNGADCWCCIRVGNSGRWSDGPRCLRTDLPAGRGPDFGRRGVLRVRSGGDRPRPREEPAPRVVWANRHGFGGNDRRARHESRLSVRPLRPHGERLGIGEGGRPPRRRPARRGCRDLPIANRAVPRESACLPDERLRPPSRISALGHSRVELWGREGSGLGLATAAGRAFGGRACRGGGRSRIRRALARSVWVRQ